MHKHQRRLPYTFFIMVFQVGRSVEALKANNATGTYHKATVKNVEMVPPNPGGNWLGAETSICFATFVRILSCGLLFKYSALYDVEYGDGTIEKQVPASNVCAAT